MVTDNKLYHLEDNTTPLEHRCRKCYRSHDLHRHHIIARVDGGGDEPSNIALLCNQCHAEWHMLEISMAFDNSPSGFEEWLKHPTLGAMYRYLFQDREYDKFFNETGHVITVHELSYAMHTAMSYQRKMIEVYTQ